MCSHYQAVKDKERMARYFGVAINDEGVRSDMWPGYSGQFIRQSTFSEGEGEASTHLEAILGLFGLVPYWSPDTKISRFTYNARSETVGSKPSFRDAWRRGQHCIIPAEGFYEPDWRSGRPVPTYIQRSDGKPMGIAGLWSSWKSPQGEISHSFTMLTISAQAHSLMRQFHKPNDEKRMVVILPQELYATWLDAGPANSLEFLRQFPADLLRATQANASNGSLFN